MTQLGTSHKVAPPSLHILLVDVASAANNPSITDEDVGMPELGLDFLEQLRNSMLVGNVGWHSKCFDGGVNLLHLCFHFLELRCPSCHKHETFRTSFGERRYDALTYP
jgi:hypothetical protein